MLFLGVDGGQTKTVAAIATERGEVIGVGVAGPANHVHQRGGEARMRRAILAQAGRELALAAATVVKKLGLEKREVIVGLVGGVFKSGEPLLGPFRRELMRRAPGAQIRWPVLPPVLAAVLLAMREAGLRPTPRTVATLRATMPAL
jgi:N-acetylglucosamine kinase-like BadF-type ATPase